MLFKFDLYRYSETGVAAICEALKSNNTLEMLSLASNNLSRGGTFHSRYFPLHVILLQNTN